jgi:hypothetical protein
MFNDTSRIANTIHSSHRSVGDPAIVGVAIQQATRSWELRSAVEVGEAGLSHLRDRLEARQECLKTLRHEYSRACRDVAMRREADPQAVRERMTTAENKVEQLRLLIGKREIVLAKLNALLKNALARESEERRQRDISRVRFLTQSQERTISPSSIHDFGITQNGCAK